MSISTLPWLLGLAACGGGSSGGGPTTTPPPSSPNPTPDSDPTPDPVPQPTPDSASLDVSGTSSVQFNVLDNDEGGGARLTDVHPQEGYSSGTPGTVYGFFGQLTFEEDGDVIYETGAGSRIGNFSYYDLQLGAGQSFTDRFDYYVALADGSTLASHFEITLSNPVGATVTGDSGANLLSSGVDDTVVEGGAGDDIIHGGHARDTLRGGDGDDLLTAGLQGFEAYLDFTGRDHFEGGAGDDRIIGGFEQTDVAFYSGNRADYSVVISGSEIIVTDLNPQDGDDGTDTLSGIEILAFADRNMLPFPGNDDQPLRVANGGLPNVAVDLTGEPDILITTPVPYHSDIFFTYPDSDGTVYELVLADGSPAPAFLSFDPEKQAIVGTPPAGTEGLYSLVLRAQHGSSQGTDISHIYFYTPEAGDSFGTVTEGEVFNGTAGVDRVFDLGSQDHVFASAGADVYVAPRPEFIPAVPATIDYSGSDAAISLDLITAVASGGHAEGDIILGTVNIIGSEYDDIILGSEDVRAIRGGGGDDYIRVSEYVAGSSSVGNPRVEGGAGADMIIYSDTYFRDGEASYASSPEGVQINLRTGEFTGGHAAGDTLVNINRIFGSEFDDTVILRDVPENNGGGYSEGFGGDDYLEGGTGADWIIGGTGSDTLIGGAGNDYFEPGEGNNYIDGGDGNDRVDFRGADNVTANLVTGTASWSTWTDTLISIENVTGTYGEDVIIGNDENNSLDGYRGGDEIYGGAGDDSLSHNGDGFKGALLDGGAGTDLFRAYGYTIIDLMAGTAVGSGFTTTLVSIENVSVNSSSTVYGTDGAEVLSNSYTDADIAFYGRGGNDELLGGWGNDFLDGGDGNDILSGGEGNDRLEGGAGADEIDGSEGTDAVLYSGADGAVFVNLGSGAVSGSHAEGDVLTSIENATGSAFGDVLVGSSGANVIRGDGGEDVILGRGGEDTLLGEAGNDLLIDSDTDSLIGGAGDDLLVALSHGASSVVKLTGSADADTFILASDLVSPASPDCSATLTDFMQGDDIIDLSDLRDAGGNILQLADILDNASAVSGDTHIDLSAFRTADGGAISGELILTGWSDPNDLLATDFDFAVGIDWAAMLPSGVEVA